MKYGLTVVTPPDAEPISVEDIKPHLKILNWDADNAVLSSYITAAREYVEAQINRQLMPATYLMTFDHFPDVRVDDWRPLSWRRGTIVVPRPPLQTVDEIQYINIDGVLTTLDPADYQYSALRYPGVISPARFKVWPVADPHSLDAVQVTFTAGYIDADTVPARAKQAIRLLVGHLYENREATVEAALNEIPVGLKSFIRSVSSGQYV